MKTKITLLLTVILLLKSVQFCSAQNANKKFSMDAMPPFVKELQRGAPPHEMMYSQPALYQHLMQRRAVLSGMLQKAVYNKQLPKEALQVLNTQLQQPENNMLGGTDKTSATNFQLVKDINQAKNASPYNYDYTYTNSFAVLNNVIYYAADDGIHGIELWRSDGTDAGTYIVKNINPGNASGNALYITVYKSKLYFTAYTDASGYELYQSDGTAAGTILFKDIIIGTGSSYPARFTVSGNTLYFITNGSASNSQLWKSNGTVAGTVMVSDIYTAASAYSIGQFTTANNLLFFTAYNYSYGRELWRSDGTPAGTYMITDINPYNNNYYDYDGPANLTSYNNLLYFSANNGTRTLWQSDGTAGGTYAVSNPNGVTLPVTTSYAQYQDQPFAIAQNSFFFAGYNYTTGTELYKYSGTAGITLVKDISAGTVGSLLTNEGIRSMNNKVYFVIPDFTGINYNLWKSDGTSANTNIVKALPGSVGSFIFYALGTNLYFNTASASDGSEPWISDGTASGTKLLKDINAGSSSSYPSEFTLCNNKVYFSAYSTSGGTELWNTNGTAGTKQVKDANTTSTASALDSYNGNNSSAIALDSNRIIFRAYTQTGAEVWKSTGTASGTVLVNSTGGQFYDSKNGKVYFETYDNTSGTNNESIYVTDGTAAGTKRLAISPGYIYNIKVADNGIVFYSTNINGYNEIWRTDSSGINFSVNTNANYNMGVAANICYFAANSSYGIELWKSDGTFSGTYLIADINSGSGGSFPGMFTPLGNKIIFSATDNLNNTYLWVSDGTTAGTSLLKNIYPYLYYGSTVLKNKLYFSAGESVDGTELFSTDGTAAGTALIKDIYTGTSGSFSQYFTTVGSTVYFEANDGVNGIELWKTTGTAASTKLVKDITAGASSSNLYNFTSAGGKLYFTNNNLLWVSDGTGAGTKAVSDANLSNVTTIGYLVGTGNKLFISGYSYAYGYELYEGDATLSAAKFVSNAVAKKINTSGLTAQLGINPFVNDLKININSPKNQQLKISVNNTGGQQLINQTINVAAGMNFITLNGERLMPGVYLINISSNTGELSLKAVKKY